MRTVRHSFPFTDADRRRFLSFVGPPTPNGCTEWTNPYLRRGYGYLTFKGVFWFAHRAAWVMTHGAIPEGLCVLHNCNNRRCVNVAHLRLGSNYDNVLDRIAAGRDHYETRNWFRGPRGPMPTLQGDNHFSHRHPELVRRGVRHHMAKLTEQDVREIRRLAASGVMQRDIAAKFGVYPTLISKIVNRQNWTHVD